jgi:serine phosphatase RsbU (regulator of sigma subunit)
VVVAVLGMASVTSLILLLDDTMSGLLPQGPAAVDRHIESELGVVFDLATLGVAQRVLHVLGIAVFVGLATLLITKRSASNRAPLAAVTLAALGVSLFAPLHLLPGPDIAAFLGSVTPITLATFWSSLAGVASLTFLATFPDGRWEPGWTRWLVVTAALVGVLTLVFPYGVVDPRTWPDWLQAGWLVGIPLAASAAQVMRRLKGPLAPATKPVLISLVAAFAAFVLLWVLQPELTPGVLDLVVVTPRLRAIYALNVLVLLTLAVFLFPVSVSVAIVRHRMFDVDLLVNRALVYGTVTAVVGLIFLLVTGSIALIAGVTLDVAFSGPAGVVLGTGLVLAFNPLRRRFQRSVDRRFDRERYDARVLIERFASEAAHLVDPATLESKLVSIVAEALHPVSVELRTGPFPAATREALGAGTAVDLAAVKAGPGIAHFMEGGSAVLVPLVAGGSLAGVLDLGARSSASRYSALDLDLLDRLAQAAGPALQLSYEVRIREREARSREREVHELELARKIQQGLLPHASPELTGWSFDSFYRPAREVGGDFFDWIALPDGRLAVVIGDVSDKGIPAALVMATCRTLLRVAAGSGLPPGRVLAEANDRLHPDIPAGMFVTCLLTVVDPMTGSMVTANAGHNLPCLRSARQVTEIMVRGMPLGLMPDMSYEEVEGVLGPEESLVLTSDGLSEAHSPDGEMFGTDRLRDAIAVADDDLLAATLRAHESFVGPAWEQEDDITMVTLTRVPVLAGVQG